MTAEFLINIDAFANERGSNISTILGVEGHFLIRFGDEKFIPNNQLQIAAKNSIGEEKLTSSDWVCKSGRWTHIAVTYSQSDHEVEVYIDGRKKRLRHSTVLTKRLTGANISRQKQSKIEVSGLAILTALTVI